MLEALSREQLQARKEKAVRFVRDVKGDPERAAEIEDESLEDYAARRKIEILNPHGGTMSRVRVANPGAAADMPSRLELTRRIRELEDENDELQDRLDQVADLAEAPEDDEGETADGLKDTLNEILDVAAPGEIEDKGEPGEE